MGLISLLLLEPEDREAVMSMMYLSRGESTASYGSGFQPIFHRSGQKKSKYAVYSPMGKLINFGAKGMEHYKDTALGLYKSFDHNDLERRRRYLLRAKGIRNKEGELTWNNPEYANYYSVKYLW